jgi:hypothetical protein
VGGAAAAAAAGGQPVRPVCAGADGPLGAALRPAAAGQAGAAAGPRRGAAAGRGAARCRGGGHDRVREVGTAVGQDPDRALLRPDAGLGGRAGVRGLRRGPAHRQGRVAGPGAGPGDPAAGAAAEPGGDRLHPDQPTLAASGGQGLGGHVPTGRHRRPATNREGLRHRLPGAVAAPRRRPHAEQADLRRHGRGVRGDQDRHRRHRSGLRVPLPPRSVGPVARGARTRPPDRRAGRPARRIQPAPIPDDRGW